MLLPTNLVGEEPYVTTLITAAKETKKSGVAVKLLLLVLLFEIK